MNTFELDKDALRKAWGGEDQYWFSLNSYKVKEAHDISQDARGEQISQSAYFVSIGYIPYFTVSNEEVMRAFVESLTNNKLKLALSKIDSENYVESFWKYFNIYPEMSEGYNDFEDSYVLEKAKKWCNENGINYSA